MATLPPLGCLPLNTIPPNSYQNCDEESNKNARFHNQLLLKAVEKLNTNDGNKNTFVVLDLYGAMASAMDQFRQGAGNFFSCFFNQSLLLYVSQVKSKYRVQEPVAAMLLKVC